jgi:hypothetical protein
MPRNRCRRTAEPTRSVRADSHALPRDEPRAELLQTRQVSAPSSSHGELCRRERGHQALHDRGIARIAADDLYTYCRALGAATLRRPGRRGGRGRYVRERWRCRERAGVAAEVHASVLVLGRVAFAVTARAIAAPARRAAARAARGWRQRPRGR